MNRGRGRGRGRAPQPQAGDGGVEDQVVSNYIPYFPLQTPPLGDNVNYPEVFANFDDYDFLDAVDRFISYEGCSTDAIQPLNFQDLRIYDIRRHFSTHVQHNTVKHPIAFLHHWCMQSRRPMVDMGQYDSNLDGVHLHSNTWIEVGKRQSIESRYKDKIVDVKAHYRLYRSVDTNNPPPHRMQNHFNNEHMDVYYLDDRCYDERMNTYHLGEPSHQATSNVLLGT